MGGGVSQPASSALPSRTPRSASAAPGQYATLSAAERLLHIYDDDVRVRVFSPLVSNPSFRFVVRALRVLFLSVSDFLPQRTQAAQPPIRPHSWFNYMYAKYIPNMCRDRLAIDCELREAELERFDGVVAFVDISGFTKLSEYLVKKHGQQSAAEFLNKFISGYFEKLVEVVVMHGGE
jgi:hypothetical protein